MIVTVGTIGRAHGIRGEVVVDARTDTPAERFAVGAVLRAEASRAGAGDERVHGRASTAVPSPVPDTLTVARSRWHQDRMLVQFDGITDRSAAEALRGTTLQAEIGPDETPADPDEFFDHQLVGLRVVTVHGADVGEVVDVLHGPNQDVLAVRRREGEDVLVPFVAQIVPVVDLVVGRVVVDPPPGLLELGQPAEPAP